jgi:NADP-dependent 3-hydroxy acid dehydrogenase YdfG
MVTGACHGLGAAICDALVMDGHVVIPFDSRFGHDVRDPQGTWRREELPEELPDVDILVNCAGINRTAWLQDLEEQTWDEVMDTNAKGIFKMTQWLLPSLIGRRGTVLNIVSNASHMPMTCSAAYNASKGAAHILTLQMARELTKKHDITVFGISPNKLAGTKMSRDIEAQVVRDRGWTPEFARQYQLNALLTGEETDPKQLADFVRYLLQSKAHHKFLSGCILPYGA